MSVRVLIPTPLQKLTKGQSEVELAQIPCGAAAEVNTTEVKAGDVTGLIEELNIRYAGIKERLCDEKGQVRRFINIYVNGEDIRFLQGQKTQVEDGAEVSIVPAIAGG